MPVKDKERRRQIQAAYRARNRDTLRKKGREYAAANRERVRVYGKEYREDNRASLAEKSAEYDKLHVAECRARRLRYYHRNRERCAEQHASWTRRNLGKCAAHNHKRRARLAGNGGEYTESEWQELKQRYGNKCLCCGKNESEAPLTVDHVIPVSKGGANDIDNIQPLCQSCNSSKKDKVIDYRQVRGI